MGKRGVWPGEWVSNLLSKCLGGWDLMDKSHPCLFSLSDFWFTRPMGHSHLLSHPFNLSIIRSVSKWLTPGIIIHSVSYSGKQASISWLHPLICQITQSTNHPVTHSDTRSVIHPPSQALINRCKSDTHWSLTRSKTHPVRNSSKIRHSLTKPDSQSLRHILIHPFRHSHTHWDTHSSCQTLTQTLIHPVRNSITHTVRHWLRK